MSASLILSASNGPTTEEIRTGVAPNLIDDMTKLNRFLVLGTSGTSYKSKGAALKEGSPVIQRLLDSGRGLEVVAKVVEMKGRGTKPDPSLYALAMCMSMGDEPTRKAAYASVSEMCGIPTMLFLLIESRVTMNGGKRKGWGRGFKRALTNWYISKRPVDLAVMMTKFWSRNKWTHQDVLRELHISPKNLSPEMANVIAYATKGMEKVSGEGDEVRFLEAVQAAKMCVDEDKMVELLKDHPRLCREHVPTTLLNSAKVWQVLLETMKPEAMLRNLSKMTSLGLLVEGSDETAKVLATFSNYELLTKANLHPIKILLGGRQYAAGKGDKGSLTWTPVQSIVKVMDTAWRKLFAQVKGAQKRCMLGVDCSASMGWPENNIPGTSVTSYEAAAAMALLTTETEPWCKTYGFSGRGSMTEISIDKDMSLTEVVNRFQQVTAGSTDTTQLIEYALENKIQVDTFFVYTDNDTNSSRRSASEALKEYRAKTGIYARLIVVAVTNNDFTIADPEDAGMLDCVGFDTALPELMVDFQKGLF